MSEIIMEQHQTRNNPKLRPHMENIFQLGTRDSSRFMLIMLKTTPKCDEIKKPKNKDFFFKFNVNLIRVTLSQPQFDLAVTSKQTNLVVS